MADLILPYLKDLLRYCFHYLIVFVLARAQTNRYLSYKRHDLVQILSILFAYESGLCRNNRYTLSVSDPLVSVAVVSLSRR